MRVPSADDSPPGRIGSLGKLPEGLPSPVRLESAASFPSSDGLVAAGGFWGIGSAAAVAER